MHAWSMLIFMHHGDDVAVAFGILCLAWNLCRILPRERSCAHHAEMMLVHSILYVHHQRQQSFRVSVTVSNEGFTLSTHTSHHITTKACIYHLWAWLPCRASQRHGRLNFRPGWVCRYIQPEKPVYDVAYSNTLEAVPRTPARYF